MKRPSARSTAEEVREDLRKRTKRVTKADVAQCVSATVGKARSCYALYIAEQYPIIREQVLGEGSAGSRPQREIMHRISDGWSALSDEEKAVYKTKAHDEFLAKQKAIDAFFEEKPEDEPVREAPAVLGSGKWGVVHGLDHPLWKGGHCTAYLVEHKLLRTRCMATVFDDSLDYKQELKVLNALNQADWEDFHPEVFLIGAEATSATAPVRCIFQQWLPTLDQCAEPVRGAKLAAVASQTARALTLLHRLGFLHLDIREKSLFWCDREHCAKLGRFHRSRALNSSGPLPYPPYAGTHRAPECYFAADEPAVDVKTEAWAFGVTLIRLASGKLPFETIEDVMNFSVNGKSMEKYPAFQELPDSIRLVVLKFLAPAFDRMELKDFLRRDDLLAKLSTSTT